MIKGLAPHNSCPQTACLNKWRPEQKLAQIEFFFFCLLERYYHIEHCSFLGAHYIVSRAIHAWLVRCRYESKEKSALNEHARRLEQTTLDDMRKELALVRQQIEIERSVYAATAAFMKKLAGRLQEESIRWSQRHDDDLNNRERDLEVGGSAAVSVVRDVLVSSVRRRLSFRLCRV